LSGLTPDGHANPYFLTAQIDDWRDHTDIFSGVELFSNRPATIGEGEPEMIFGASVSGGLMSLLGVPPQGGRILAAAAAHAGRWRVVVVSDEVRRRRFAADPKIVGRTLRVDDQAYEIVGVMPRGFNFPYGQRQFWIPLVAGDAGVARGTISAVARLADG